MPTIEIKYEFCSNRRHTNGLLGCMINAAGSRNTDLDFQHHFQAAARAIHANTWILCDKGVSVLHRLRYFEKVLSPVACFGASHRAIHKDDLAPADINWASPWHEILYDLARDFTWVEKSTRAVGLRWIETVACHMHAGSMEVRFLCCNLALGTLDPQDFGMEHQRATEARTACLHLGHSVAEILHLGGTGHHPHPAGSFGPASFDLT